MNLNDISDPKAKEMLKNAGITQEKLKNVNVEKFNRILSDPEAVKKLLSTPMAQALLKKFNNE